MVRRATPPGWCHQAALANGPPRAARARVDTLAPVPEEISRGPRRAAAALTGLQAVALLGFAVFYVYELAVGEGSDPVRVLMSALLIAVFGVGLGVMAKAWLGDATWPKTPTIVWSALLFPVGGGMIQGGLRLLGWGLIAMALVTAWVALAAKGVDSLASDDADGS